jgi:hypothetical protein
MPCAQRIADFAQQPSAKGSQKIVTPARAREDPEARSYARNECVPTVRLDRQGERRG